MLLGKAFDCHERGCSSLCSAAVAFVFAQRALRSFFLADSQARSAHDWCHSLISRSGVTVSPLCDSFACYH